MKTDRNAINYLTHPARISGYLNQAVATGDPSEILLALGAIARAEGMTKVAKATGLSRENLYRALSARSGANFSTVLSVADALGFDMMFRPKEARAVGRSTAKVDRVVAGGGRKVAKSRRST
jgi:probable addiction module antidote protein